MSFLHLIYLGHFDHEGGLVQFTCTPHDPILKPVVRRPLDMGVVKRLAQEVSGLEDADLSLPTDWNLWVEDGYLAGNRYGLSHEAIDFIVRLIGSTGCNLVDFNARSIIRPEDLNATTGGPVGRFAPVR